MSKKLKMTAVIAILTVVSILLSGCSFSIVSVEKLVRPPYPSGDMKEVQKAFYADVEKSITLLIPQIGEYRTSFIMHDLDGDKAEEVLAFYLSEDGDAYLNILKQTKGQWKTESVFHGSGNVVEFVSFIDMNNDSLSEILVGWSRVNATTTNKYFTVLTYDTLSKSFEVRSLINENYTLLSTADIDNDKDTDILITVLDTTQSKPEAYARMFSYQEAFVDDKLDVKSNVESQSGMPVVTMVNEVALDGNITSYYRIYNESTETENIFYIDAYKGDSQMITEVLVCEKTPEYLNGVVDKKALEAQLKDKTTNTMTATWRGLNLPARDIDNDGNIEIPVEKIMENQDASLIDQAEKETSLMDWVRYRNGSLQVVKSSFVSSDGDYYIYIADDIKNQVKAKVSKRSNTMVVYANTSIGPWTELLYLREYSKTDWDIMTKSAQGAEYTLLGENQDTNTVYAYKLTSYGQNDFGLTAKYVEANFVVI